MPPRLRRAAVAALLAASALVPARPTAAAPAFQRISGADRFATAAAVSQAFYQPGVPAAFVATGESFPDALAGGPMAALNNGPILLTNQATLPEPTVAELRRLQPGRIVVFGGPSAVSPEVETQLKEFVTAPDLVIRISGDDRFGTSAAISRSTFANGVQTVYIATAFNFPDALAAGAAGGAVASPVLLTSPGELSPVVAAELDRLDPGSIIVLGREGQVSIAVEQQLRQFTAGPVARVAGDNRYGTAAAVSTNTYRTPPVERVFLATGTGFADALGAGAAAGLLIAPLLLTRPDCMPPFTDDELNRLNPQSVVIVGGEGAIGAAAGENRIRCR